MTFPAFYMDGQSAHRFEVVLSYVNKSLIIHDEKGECLTTWETGKIYPVEKIKKGQPLLLGCSSRGSQRLKIEDPETKNWLFNMLPGLARRTDHRKETRLAWKLSGGLVACAALVYFSLPFITQAVVSQIPLEWEREVFAGTSKKIARSLGSSKQCVGPSGYHVVQSSLRRLVGEDKASRIKVTVVQNKMVNAFATPGNEIILMSGLIEEAKTPEEVIGVLAHELGHVEERHALQAMARGAGLGFLLAVLSGGSVTDLAGLLAETSYSRDHERAADQYALDALKRANIKTDGLAAFFEKLHQENHTFESALQFISTHPMSKERADMIRAQKGGGDALSAKQWQDVKQICLMLDPL